MLSINDVVKQARDLAELYKMYALDSNNVRRCEKAFIQFGACFDVPQFEIKDLPRGLGPDAPLGAFLRTADGFVILVRPDIESAMRRFVVTKEIFHFVLDCDQYHDMELVDHVLRMVADKLDPNALPPSFVVEYAAQAAAAEFLFPHAERLTHAEKKTDFAMLAQIYDLPIEVIDRFMSDVLLKTLDPELFFGSREPETERTG